MPAPNRSLVVVLLGLVAVLSACASAPLNKQALHTGDETRPLKTTTIQKTTITQKRSHPVSPAQYSATPDRPLMQNTRSAVNAEHRNHRKPDNSTDVLSQEELLVSTLLTRSSAAKTVQSSDNPRVLSLYAQANSDYQAALQAGRAGDAIHQAQLFRNAKRIFFQAVRLNTDNHLQQKVDNSNYQKRLESTKTLLTALRRIAKEKKASKDYVEVLDRIEEQLLQAQKSFAAGNPRKAREILDLAFVTVKESIIKFRNGDTLIRSLNFASPEEEYRYELDRNETHKLLFTMLSSNKNSTLFASPRIQHYLDDAANLRRQAEQHAQSAQYKTAIELLEKATQLIIRAIRAAGIYIPG
jgi:hypothetical protein